VKVISFHSYKGGVGRTLLAIYLADLLARTGKRVCLVDLDLKAPGVAKKLEKLAHSFENLPTQKPYQLSEIQFQHGATTEKRDLHSLILELSSSPGGSGGVRFADFVSTVRLEPRNVVAAPAADSGILYYVLTKPREQLLPLPPASWPDGFFDPVIQAQANDPQYQPAVFLHEHLIKELQDQFALDYLLIDCPAGDNAIARFVTGMLSSVVVCPFTASSESFLGMKLHLSSIFKTLELHRPLWPAFERAAPVLTRVQGPLLKSVDRKVLVGVNEMASLVNELITEYGKNLGFKRIPTVYEDPFLEMDELYRLQSDTSSYTVAPFHVSLVDIAQACCPGLSAADCWGALTGVKAEPAINSDHTLMVTDPSTGIIKNPRDLTPNISLRIPTLISILKGMKSYFLDNELPTTSREQFFDQMLYSGGVLGGRGFAAQLKANFEAIEKDNCSAISTPEKIEYLCEWDAEMGFGKPEFNAHAGTILLSPPKDALRSQNDLNIFAKLIEGYFNGALENLGKRAKIQDSNGPIVYGVDPL